MSRTVQASCAVGLLLLALLTAPNPATAHGPAEPDLTEEDVIAESPSDDTATAGGTAKVNQLQRSPTGLVVLAWTMQNEGTEAITFAGTAVGGTYLYQGSPYSGITLLAEAAQTRYHPLMDEESRCLCSAGRAQPPEFVAVLGANRYSTYHSTFLLPEDVDEVTVEVPGFEPIEEVPVTHL